MSDLSEMLKRKDIAFREHSAEVLNLVGETTDAEKSFYESIGRMNLNSAEYIDAVLKFNKHEPAKLEGGMHCVKCGENSVIAKQIQFRSGDEASDTSYECTNPACRNRMRVKPRIH